MGAKMSLCEDLTKALIEFRDESGEEKLNKVLEIIDQMYKNNEIIPVPGYYWGNDKGFTFEEIRTMDGKSILLSMLSEPKFFKEKSNNNQLLGMNIRMFFANYFSVDRFDGIIINSDSDIMLPLPNNYLVKLKLFEDFKNN